MLLVKLAWAVDHLLRAQGKEMSRVAKAAPVTIPAAWSNPERPKLAVKGKNGTLKRILNAAVIVTKRENVLKFAPSEGAAGAELAKRLVLLVHWLNNMVIGVTAGFERKLGAGWCGITVHKLKVNLLVFWVSHQSTTNCLKVLLLNARLRLKSY